MRFLLSKDQILPLYISKGNSGCIASNKITVDGIKIGYMYREKPSPHFPDSGWRFFAGEESDEYTQDPDNFQIFDLNTICNYDKDIIPYLESCCGSAYIRTEKGFVDDKL